MGFLCPKKYNDTRALAAPVSPGNLQPIEQSQFQHAKPDCLHPADRYQRIGPLRNRRRHHRNFDNRTSSSVRFETSLVGKQCPQPQCQREPKQLQLYLAATPPMAIERGVNMTQAALEPSGPSRNIRNNAFVCLSFSSPFKRSSCFVLPIRNSTSAMVRRCASIAIPPNHASQFVISFCLPLPALRGSSFAEEESWRRV